MRQLINILLILTILPACKAQDAFIEARLNTAKKFVECLANNTPEKILNYTYSGIDDKIDEKESRDFYVNKAYKFIKKFGLPTKDKWDIKYDPKNNFERLVIKIPLFKGYDTTFNLLKADIILTFPPPQISDKIYRYEIADEYEIKPTISAPVVDTTKRNK